MKEIYTALSLAQSEMIEPKRTAKAYNYNYAPLDEVVKITRPILAKQGLAVIQFPINDGDRIGVKTIITHKSGEVISDEFTTPVTKMDPQSVGSLITYYRRYALMAVCGLAPEDDDAQIIKIIKTKTDASMAVKANKMQVDRIKYLLGQIGKNESGTLEHFGVKTLSDLTKVQASIVIKQLEEKPKGTIQ